MAKVSIEYYGMPGSGRTVTEAKRDAGARIERALSGSYAPILIEWRGWAILVWREPAGWCDRIIRDGDKGTMRPGHVHGCANHETREECVASCQFHLAQLAWTHEDPDEAPDFVKDPEKRREFLGWVRFQRQYRQAREAGLNDNDAHAFACDNPWRTELREQVEGVKR